VSSVDYSVRERVALLRFGQPPVNSLGHAVRADLLAGLERAVADPAVGAIVLTGANGKFSAGADIKEFNSPLVLRPPTLRHLVKAVEDCPKPVTAAITGVCLGGGLELALGCHYRVATADAQLGLPEVKLGLLPGAGGTQRLPRVVGIETALNMIVSGEPVPAQRLAKTALLDRIVAGPLEEGAVAFAVKVLTEGAARPRVRDRTVAEPNIEALAQFARNTVKAMLPNFPAPLACIDAVVAATGEFEAGIEQERAAFETLGRGSVSKALRHVFFAERAAARVPDVPDSTPVRGIASAAVVGGGTMGTGIALCFLNVGLPVRLLEVTQDALERGVARIRDTFDGQVKKGKLEANGRDERMKLLTPTLKYDSLADCDIVIEAVFEDMGVKEKVFEALDAVMKRGAILASNTSTLDLNHIASVTGRPQDVIGTHFFSPANIMKLLEVVRGASTAKDVLATTLKLARTLKKTPVVAGVCDGFIGNRMILQYSRQAEFLLAEGASPAQVDGAIERFGFAMGPFRMGDLAGNDILWHIRKRQRLEHPERRFLPIGDRLCEAGRFGQKSQAGWYDYRPGDRSAYPSPVVDALLVKARAELGLTPRPIDEREIVERLVYALVNEGAQILDERIAQRASDIDVVYLTGYGFPVWRGGPMFYADQVGLYDVVQRMRQFAHNPNADPPFWQPAPLLARLAAEGGAFNTPATGLAA
jgi:3-hydroxyacyl-CoA dehydrogenase